MQSGDRRSGLGHVWAAAILLFLGGCGLLIPVETAAFRPATDAGVDRITGRYEAQLRAMLAGHEADRLRHFAGFRNGWTGPVPDWIRPEIDAADALAASMEHPVIAPLPAVPTGPRSYDGRWRLSQSWLYLGSGRRDWDRAMLFSGINALETRVLFRSLDWRQARVTATCDGPVTLTQPGGSTGQKGGAAFDFVLEGHSRDRTALTVPLGTDRCTLLVKFAGQPARNLRLEREELADPMVAALDSRFDVCATPRADRMDALESAFFASRWLSQTCAQDPGHVRLLPDSRDGFNAKVAALSGANLPDAAYDAGDPTVPLDVSRAPKLDLIVLSFLDVKADFSGYIMLRLLRFHAARGTRIRILVTDQLENRKDRQLYEGLAADFPNVQLQFYNWTAPDFAPVDELVSALHRVQHIKLFATLSSQPGHDRAILGGRNIHDGFLFDRALDLKRFPWLQDYGMPGETSLNYFSTYHDFEVELSEPAIVRAMVSQMSTFWHRDTATTVYRPFSVAVEEDAAHPVALRGARQFMSVPFLDRAALEHYWIDLIDSARNRVQIVTPYLNPTPRIEAALNRALSRGVKVEIVARIRLEGDLGGRLMTEMNMLFVERYAGRMTLWEYDPPKVVLHSKMLIIDERLSVVTSTNLNRRSFLHDTENGLAVLDPAFTRRLQGEVQDYIAQSRRLGPDDSDVRPIVRRLFRLKAVRDLF